MFKIILSLAGIQVLQAIVQIIKIKIVAVLLGPEGMGIISLINQFVILVIQISTLSLPWVATRYMAVAFSHNKSEFCEKVKVFFRGILGFSLVGMIVAVLIIFKFNYLLDVKLQQYQLITLISLSMVVPMALKGFLLSVFTTAGKYKFSAITMFFNVVIGSILMLLGIWISGLKGFFIGQAIAEYGVVFYCIYKLRTELTIQVFAGRLNVLTEIAKLDRSIQLIIYGSILYFLCPIALIILRYSLLEKGGEFLVGLYQAVHGLVLYITVALGQATNLYLDPILKKDILIEEKLVVANQYLRSITLILGSIMVVVILFPEFLLKLLYSSAFIDGANFLYAFMILESLNVISAVYLGMMVGQGWYKTHFIIGIITHSLVGLISFYQIPTIGIWGSILAFGMGALFTLVILYISLYREVGNFIESSQAVLSIFIFSTLSFAGYWVSQLTHLNSWIPSNIMARLVALLFYWAILFMILKPIEKEKLWNGLEKLKHRFS